MVVYEDNFTVSVGSEVAALIADEAWRWLDAPVKRLGGLDVPSMPYAEPDGGLLHAQPGKDHQGPEGPGGVLMGKTTRVVMPQLGESVHEGTISKWLVKPGDKVVEFEPMLEVDTDKVNAEVPAPVTGMLREILAKEGETVQAGPRSRWSRLAPTARRASA